MTTRSRCGTQLPASLLNGLLVWWLVVALPCPALTIEKEASGTLFTNPVRAVL